MVPTTYPAHHLGVLIDGPACQWHPSCANLAGRPPPNLAVTLTPRPGMVLDSGRTPVTPVALTASQPSFRNVLQILA